MEDDGETTCRRKGWCTAEAVSEVRGMTKTNRTMNFVWLGRKFQLDRIES